MATKKFTRMTGALQTSALRHAEPDRLFGGSRQGMRLVEPKIEDIDVNPDQPRRHFDPEAMQTLADSIEQHGLRQPIGVQHREDGRWLLVFGERRLRACRQLGLATIQAVVTDGDPGEIALIENVQREELSVFETADAYAALMRRRGFNQSTLARVVGTTPTAITRLMALRKVHLTVRRDFENGHSDIPKSLLMEVAEITDEARQMAVWRAVRDGATVREVRALKAELRAAGGENSDASSEASSDGTVPPVGTSEKRRAKGGDPLEKSVSALERLVRPYREGAASLDPPRRQRLEALRRLIDDILGG